MRLRLQLTGWDRRTLTLTDTPRPDCPRCEGEGGHAYDYGDHKGEYAGTEWDPAPAGTKPAAGPCSDSRASPAAAGPTATRGATNRLSDMHEGDPRVSPKNWGRPRLPALLTELETPA